MFSVYQFKIQNDTNWKNIHTAMILNKCHKNLNNHEMSYKRSVGFEWDWQKQYILFWTCIYTRIIDLITPLR